MKTAELIHYKGYTCLQVDLIDETFDQISATEEISKFQSYEKETPPRH